MKTAPTTRDDALDLNPLIDVITVLLVFFIIGGSLNDRVTDQITVPPTRSGLPVTTTAQQHVRIDLSGDGQGIAIAVGRVHRFAGGALERQPYVDLRELLDRVHERAPKRWQDGIAVADVAVELRADADTPYRMVQEIMAIAADAIDPASATPRTGTRRAFTDLLFATRDAGG